jgi:hypothetical protein
MHPFSKKLAALTGKYTRSDIIKLLLLHYKLPIYLHVVQALCRSKGYWKWLDINMDCCYPEETVYEE